MIEFLRHESALPYNPNDKSSIIEYAQKLAQKSLRNTCSKEADSLKNNKGAFGQLVENLYFFIKTNNSPEPDFSSVGMELKTAGLNKKNSQWRAKESMMLSGINYHNIIKEEFSKSAVINKSECLLFIFYEYKKSVLPLDLIVKVVGSWTFSDIAEKDKVVIKKDWEIIRDKVSNGKAHELSRSDTNYLCSVTSGTSSQFTTQPNGPKARTRKYAFKSSFMHSVINKLQQNKDGKQSLFSTVTEAKNNTIENMVNKKISPYINKTSEQLELELWPEKAAEKLEETRITEANSKEESPLQYSRFEIPKQKFSIISKNILNKIFNVPLNTKLEDFIDEFSKSELVIKTVRLKENSVPKEDISFPAFKYEELVKENWEESTFHSLIDRKFLFIFFQYKGENLILKKVKFWNMPNKDINKAKKVWEKTQEIVRKGNIVNKVRGSLISKIFKQKNKQIRVTNFPGKKFNSIAHVRPHAKSTSDTYPLPVKDKLTSYTEYTKHSFWLNAAYVKNEIFLKE